MVRIVKQESEARPASAQCAKPAHEKRIVPLVNDDDVSAVCCALEIEVMRIVHVELCSWDERCGFTKMLSAAIAQGVFAAPAIARLVNRNLVAECEQFACDAAQEVSVAVIPARDEGVTEEDNPHVTHSSTGAAGAVCCASEKPSMSE
jgi:hypothetical protein